MRNLLAGSFFLFVVVVVVGCAATQETEERPSVEAEPQRCELTPADLWILRVAALEYLVEEWPVLDKRCEHISETVVVTKLYGCMILGGPRRDSSCEVASHFGYGIIYDQDTLDPIEIRWLTEPKQK